jgi:hypothetical protein
LLVAGVRNAVVPVEKGGEKVLLFGCRRAVPGTAERMVMYKDVPVTVADMRRTIINLDVKYPRLKPGGLEWGGITPVSLSLGLTSLSQGRKAIGLRYRRKHRYPGMLALVPGSTSDG